MTIRRVLSIWVAWRSRAAMRRALPILSTLDAQEAAYRRSHKRGSAKIVRLKKEAVLQALKGGAA